MLLWLACLPACLLSRLQSVLNAAAWSIAGLLRSDNVTDTLACRFYWLMQAPESTKFKLAVIVGLCTTLHLGICLICCATSLICRRKVNFGRQLPDISTSAVQD